MSAEELTRELTDALADLDRTRVQSICDQLAELVDSDGEDFSVRSARAVLSALRAKRYFAELCDLGTVFRNAGVHDAKVRRLYAQGLIEKKRFKQAEAFLTEILDDPETPEGEVKEARGLLGRVYKQRYVGLSGDAAPTERQELMVSALEQYRAVFDEAPHELWHGVNVVALLARADRDNVAVDSRRDFTEIARDIVHAVEDLDQDRKATMWDLASAMEASIALGDETGAVRYGERYALGAAAGGADQFEYGSTLRQLREVWGATDDDFIGRSIVPLLEAVMVNVAVRTTEGGSVSMEANTLRFLGTAEGAARFEKVFDETDRYKPMEWFESVRSRSLAIGKVKQADGRGVGTGFLVRGSSLCAALDDEWLFLTNSHVISDVEAVRKLFPPEKMPLLPGDAFVQFQMLWRADKPKFSLGDIVWTSPPGVMDATLVRLGEPFYDDEIESFPLSAGVPDPGTRPRLYIIGHPNGSDLSVSLHDNHLIEFDAKRLRYRTPTNPGSSGSPVFDDQWRLVGLHHAGSGTMESLDDPGMRVEANEGIRIDAITTALKEYFSEGLGAGPGAHGGRLTTQGPPQDS